jgi:acyl-CoA synthetase (AMP-forming)/AMP-acid ligase II
MGSPFLNVLAVLQEVAARVPDRPALVMESGAIFFGRLWDRADRASAGLRRMGLSPGNRAIPGTTARSIMKSCEECPQSAGFVTREPRFPPMIMRVWNRNA